MPIVIALVILFAASFLMALPRKKRGLAHALRFLMLVIGVIGPLGALWLMEKPEGPIPPVPAILSVVAIAPLSAAVALAATGWQAILRRRYGVEEALDATLLEPGLYFPSYPGSSSSSGLEDLIFGCALILIVWTIVALFVLGIIIAAVFDQYLLPPVKTHRTLRAALCFAYACPMMAGTILLLGQLLA